MKLDPEVIASLQLVILPIITTAYIIPTANLSRQITKITKMNGRKLSFHPSTSPPKLLLLVTMLNASPPLSIPSHVIMIIQKTLEYHYLAFQTHCWILAQKIAFIYPIHFVYNVSTIIL